MTRSEKVHKLRNAPSKRPTRAGWWLWSDGETPYRRVLVTETPASGRMCAELKQGGSAMCGLAAWSGFWVKG